ADVRVTLTVADGGGTSLSYDADAVVGGMIGGVGQRMLTGVSKKMAAEFFTAVDAHLSGALAGAGFPADGGAPEPSGLASLGLPPGPSTVAPPSAVQPAAVAGQVFTAPEPSVGDGRSTFIVGAIVGAAAALAGALVGGWLTRRRTDIGVQG
ncbi:MAG: SRPBCC domain-containing protein, partial [Nocardioidaceae bacterium]